MTIISIIGSGNIATAIGTRAAKHGHTIPTSPRNRWPGRTPLTPNSAS
jgi:hypothetical protein